MGERWQDDPAYSLETPTEQLTVKDDPCLAVWKRYRDCCREWGQEGSAEWLTARNALAEWKAQIDSGHGREWAQENRDKFEKAMNGCNVAMDFTRIDGDLTGAELVAACREIFAHEPQGSRAHKEAVKRAEAAQAKPVTE